MKGMDAGKLEQLDADVFKSTIETFKAASTNPGKKMKKTGVWTYDQLRAFGKVARKAYGEPKAYTENTLLEMGDMAAGLVIDDITRMSVAAVKGLDGLAITNMDKSQVRAFDANKIKNMLAQTKKAINGEKLVGLDPSQKAAAVSCGGSNTRTSTNIYIIFSVAKYVH